MKHQIGIKASVQAALLAGAIGWVSLIPRGAGLLFAQGFTAAITGTVRDMSGAVLPGAAVTVKHLETGLTRAAETNAAGAYTVPSLPVGRYEVSGEKMGFKQEVRAGIDLVVGQEAVVNLTLQVGSVVEQVTVTGEAPIVNTTLASTSGLITEAQIKDMPLNGRSFHELLLLNTNTVNNSSNSGGASFSVAGKRTETNRFTLNGVDYVGDNATGQYIAPNGISGYLLGVEAVREYNVLGTTYGAEYGKRAGAQVTAVTMSGTNQLHGTAFEYLRNSALDARNFFDRDVAPFKRNQFGGSLGGPLKKDKLFLFGNYEGYRERLGVSTVAFVPDLQVRQGLLPCNVVFTTASARAANCPDLNAYVPVPNLERRMLPFANYFWPAPNGGELFQNGLATGTAESRSNPARSTQEDFGLGRFDYNVSSADTVSANYTADKGLRASPQADPIFLTHANQDLYSLGVQETHIFSPTVLNVALFGASRAGADSVATPVTPIPENLVFMKGGNRSNPGAFTIGGGSNTAQVASVTSPNGQNPYLNNRQYYTGSDDLRMTRGRHNFSLGVWVQRVQETAFSSAQNNAGTAGYLDWVTFLQDSPTQFLAAPNPIPLNFRSTEAAWYIQDELKLRPNLTVRLGLRDEMTTGWNEPSGHSSNYLFDQNGVILTDPLIGDSPFIENHAIALWQPRVGVAWDPGGAGKWAVRAGFGIHNDLQDNLTHRLNSNPPFNGRVQFNQPLWSIIPLPSTTPPAPSCSASSPLQPPACSIYAPGGLDPAMRTPTIQQWNLTVERGITQDFMMQLSYVGNQSYHISTTLDMNTIFPQLCENPQGCVSGGILPANQRSVVPQGTTYIPPGTRPNPFVGSTLSWFMFGTSSYQGGSVSLLKRSRGGLTFKTNYTFSKVMDINSAILAASGSNEPGAILNRMNLKLNRGIGSYSLTHQFNTNFSYQLPFGKGQRFGGGASGWKDQLIGGWQWNGLFNAQSGFPITPSVGSNRSGNGDSRIPDVVNRNPDFKGKVILGTPEHWFDPNAFSLPLAGTFGNVARGAFFGPPLFNLDTSLFKKFSVSDKYSLQFRAEAFNVLNHANFDVPNPIVFQGNSISGSAGVINGTANRERLIQFALKLLF